MPRHDWRLCHAKVNYSRKMDLNTVYGFLFLLYQARRLFSHATAWYAVPCSTWVYMCLGLISERIAEASCYMLDSSDHPQSLTYVEIVAISLHKPFPGFTVLVMLTHCLKYFSGQGILKIIGKRVGEALAHQRCQSRFHFSGYI